LVRETQALVDQFITGVARSAAPGKLASTSSGGY
jgi:hypothetical protein